MRRCCVVPDVRQDTVGPCSGVHAAAAAFRHTSCSGDAASSYSLQVAVAVCACTRRQSRQRRSSGCSVSRPAAHAHANTQAQPRHAMRMHVARPRPTHPSPAHPAHTPYRKRITSRAVPHASRPPWHDGIRAHARAGTRRGEETVQKQEMPHRANKHKPCAPANQPLWLTRATHPQHRRHTHGCRTSAAQTATAMHNRPSALKPRGGGGAVAGCRGLGGGRALPQRRCSYCRPHSHTIP